MNKLLTKIAVSLIGVALAIGVGVAAGRSGSEKAEPVQATSKNWKKLTSNPTSGTKYLIVDPTYGKLLDATVSSSNVNTSSNTADVTISSNKISSVDDSKAWTFTYDSTNKFWTIYNGSYYIGNASGSTNQLKTYAANSDGRKNTISNSSGTFTITAYAGYKLRYNNDNNAKLFRFYSSSGTVNLYEVDASGGLSVTYNGNGNTGGTVPTDATSYSSGNTVTVKGNTGSLVRVAGGFTCTFGGWNTSADGTGTSRAIGSTFSITASVTLYAVWLYPTDEGAKTYTLGSHTDFSSWTTGYNSHTLEYTETNIGDVDVVFAEANKPSSGSAIEDMPVTKGQNVEFKLDSETHYISAITANAKQWGTKDQTITIHYSNNGGSSYTTVTDYTSNFFKIRASSLGVGTNAIKLTFSSTENQIGIESFVVTYAVIPVAVTSLVVSGTGISDNALSIGSDDTSSHTITVTINSTATDKQIDIAHYSGTSNLFTLGGLTSGHITANSSGVGTFTITGTEGTSGSETFRIISHSTDSKYVDLVVSAYNASATNYSIVLDDDNKTNYSLSGTTYAEEDSKINDLYIVPNAKFLLPSEITVTGTGVTSDYWEYTPSTGKLYIAWLIADLEISFEETPADYELIASGYKSTFKEGESFDTGDLEVCIFWEDETSEVVDVEDCTIDSSNFNSAKPGSYTITVSYTYDEELLEDSYTVTVTSYVTYSYFLEDELTRTTFGVTGTSYTAWSGKSKASSSSGINSTAVYAGKTASPDSGTAAQSIQMNSDSPNGIITTTSGGLARKVTVSWNEDAADGRTLNIYGKNAAYSESSDLWDNTKQGTLIGSIVNGTSTELTISTDYAYIGIRSNKNALYLDSITIKWEETVAAASDVSAVNTFITNNMHPSISSGTSGTGLCKSSGWYTAAKTAFASLSDKQKAIILTSSSFALTSSDNDWYYNQIKDRLSAWAKANGETFNTSTGAFSSNTNVQLLKVTFDTTGSVTLIVLSILVLTTIGGYFYMRKRKEADIND